MTGSRPVERPVCIIPARGGSKRLPRKNIALLGGKPLLAYAIEAAYESGVFAAVYVSSEDEEILGVARQYGAGTMQRTDTLATDSAQVKQVCLAVLEELAARGEVYKEFAVLLTTNPLRTAQDIRAAYEIFKKDEADFVMSLVPFSHPPQRAVWAPEGCIVPYYGVENMKQTQLLDTLYRHDGSIILGRVDAFRKSGEFYGQNVVPYYMPSERSVDIDNPLDLQWAEFLLSLTGSRRNGATDHG